MAKETEERTVSREAAADRLEDVADRLRAEGSFDVNVSNRTSHLSPPEEVGMEVSVRERSTVFRGNREGVTVKLDWRPESV